MTYALLAALGAAICSGVAAILQARAVGSPETADRLGPRMAVRLARSGTYLAGLALVAAGFLLSVMALQELPVFVVAVARACSLAVTALLAWPLLGVRIGRWDVLALGAMAVGLLLVVSAGEGGPATSLSAPGKWGLLLALVVLALLARVIERGHGPRAGVALACVAGLSFGLVGVAARTRPRGVLLGLLADPAMWALAGAALLGLIVYAAALQRSSVTSATAALVGLETLSGAAIGVILLGDSPRAGWELAGVAGFALALAGALVLAGSEATRVTHATSEGVSPVSDRDPGRR